MRHATEVGIYGIIPKLMCSGRKQIQKKMIARIRMRRKIFLIRAFCGAAAATFVQRFVWMQHIPVTKLPLKFC